MHRNRGFSVGILLQVLGVFLVIGCSGAPVSSDPPFVSPRLWIADPAKMGILRTQENAMISCAADNFADYVCMSWEDYSALLFQVR